MDQAHSLARWVAQQPRPVTAGRVLRRSDVTEAGVALGVAVPQRVRTAADVPALHRPWCVAVSTGLLVVDAGMADAGPALAAWPPADDGALLDGWLAGLRAVCAAESDRRHEESVTILAFTVLSVLALDALAAGDELEKMVRAVIHSNPDLYGTVPYNAFDRYADPATGQRLGGLLTLLGMFGAVAGEPKDPQITPLGRWALARTRADARAGVPEPINADLPAEEVVARLAGADDGDDAWEAVQPWLAARTEVAAAREILGAAVGATATQRLATVEVVAELGEPALPAWREMAQADNVGPHARAMLASWERGQVVSAADQRWLAIETAAAALVDAGPDEALCEVYDLSPGADLDACLAVVRDSGHPEAQALERALAQFIASGASRSVDQVLQLKVTLGRWQPPIWRRVLVPATATLGKLHRVIQVLFGWDGDHLHAFTVGRRRYSDPFYQLDLDIGDEYELRLKDAFTPSVKKIIYEYDFGAGWRHEIVLERTAAREAARTYPTCTAFQSDSPVEYWSEDDPQDPDPFDLDEVNRLLARKRGWA